MIALRFNGTLNHIGVLNTIGEPPSQSNYILYLKMLSPELLLVVCCLHVSQMLWHCTGPTTVKEWIQYGLMTWPALVLKVLFLNALIPV